MGTGRRVSWRAVALTIGFALIAAACGSDGGDGDTGAEPGAGTEAPTGNTGSTDNGGTDPDTTDDAIVVEDGTATDEEPQPGGTLRVGLISESGSLNPAVTPFSASGYQMAQTVIEPLFVWDTEFNAVPYLAESATPSEDLTQWTITLRPGIEFHDGTPLDAQAVVDNIETLNASPLVGLFTQLLFVEPDVGPIAEAIDPLTVRYNLAEPNALFLTYLTSQAGMVASPTWLTAAAEDPSLNQRPVGTGPYELVSRVQDDMTRVERWDDYWGDAPYLDAIEFLPITDPDAMADRMIRGDDLDTVGTTTVATTLALRGEDDLVNIEDDTGADFFIMMNTSVAPFDDIRAREALTVATARDQYIRLVTSSEARPSDSMFAPGHRFHAPDVVQTVDTPEAAAPLVEAYCADVPTSCSDGRINMELFYSGPSVVQEEIQMLLGAGWSDYFNMTPRVQPEDELIFTLASGQYTATTWRQFEYIDPELDTLFLSCGSISAASLNWPRNCDPEIDALLADQRVTTDVAERQALWSEIQQRLNADFIYIFLSHILWNNSFHQDVKNVCGDTTPDGVEMICTNNGIHFFDQIWLDR